MKHYFPIATMSQKPIFGVKVKIKVTRSLIFVSFETIISGYAVFTSQASKVKVKVKEKFIHNKQNKQMGQKQYAPDPSIRGIKTLGDYHLKLILGSRYMCTNIMYEGIYV